MLRDRQTRPILRARYASLPQAPTRRRKFLPVSLPLLIHKIFLFLRREFAPIQGQTPFQPLNARSAPTYPRNQFSPVTKTLRRVVRLTAIIILIGCLHASAGVNAQERISINMKSAPLEKVFAEIEARSGYTVFYNTEVLKYSGPVTIEMKDALIGEVMRQVLKGLPLEYNIQDKTIFIKHVNHTSVAVDPAGPGKDGTTPSTVSGTVQTDAGQPLAGATVYIRKLKKSGMTDAKGAFEMKDVPDGEYEIEISYVGYEPLMARVIVMNHNGTLTVALKESMSKLDETQVIAYGTTTQRLNTGDVTTVTSKEIEEQPVSNPLAAIEGRVPGLVIAQNTGEPGGAFAVNIRGQNSISNGNDPFYVIDGVPYPSETLGLVNGVLYNGSPLNFINPADIESIEILKDADATSIYGSRAANGAILITTKKGKAGGMKIDLNTYSGIGKVTRQMKILNTQQYLQVRHEAFYNDSIALGDQPSISNAPDLLLWDPNRYTDWQKLLVGNTARYYDAQGSVSGGTVNTQYLVAGGYHRETTVFPVLLPGQAADQKASVHFNLISVSSDKRFKLNMAGSYISDLNTIQPNDFTGIAYSLPPDAPAIHNLDGSLNWAPVAAGQLGTWSNPFALLYQTYKGRTSNLVSNAVVSYTLLPGLEVKGSMGYTNTQTDEVETFPTTSNDPGLQITSGSSLFNTTNTRSWIIEPQAYYHVNIGEGIFSALAGLTFEENSAIGKNISADGFINDALLTDMGAASKISSIVTNADYKYNAVFGRLNYNWQGKYLFNVTARRDGSSRFGPGRQFADFGAVGAAWIFSEEEFIKKNLSFLSFGKIRGSFGASGNDQIGDYQFMDLYSATRYSYQGIQALYPTNLYNNYLAWELDKKLEGGIELGLIKNRIMMDVSYFRNRSGNQLVSTPVSLVTGFGSIASNLPALVENSGIEATFRTTNVRTRDFLWTSSINFTIPNNKLISFPNFSNSPYSNSLIIGKPITIVKVFHMAGVNDTTGIFQFSTGKAGLTYNPTANVDNTIVVNTSPRYYGGLQNNFRWRGLGLDILFQFTKQMGRNIFYNIAQSYSPPGFMSNQPTVVLNRWQKPGDVKPFQQFSQDFSGQAFTAWGSYVGTSDLVYSDASFIRLKNLSISYSVADKITQRWHLQSLRVYIHGQNLLTFTKYNGNDPESQGYALPPLRVWAAGFEVSF